MSDFNLDTLTTPKAIALLARSGLKIATAIEGAGARIGEGLHALAAQVERGADGDYEVQGRKASALSEIALRLSRIDDSLWKAEIARQHEFDAARKARAKRAAP